MNQSVPKQSDSPDHAASNQEQARRILELFDTVLERHVDPPTRGGLVLSLCRALQTENPPELGLGRTISAADGDELIVILANQLDKIGPERRDEVVVAAINQTLETQAFSRLIKASDQRVNEQLAANRYVGIGIALGVDDSIPTMMTVFEDGPADLAGAKKGDRIEEVNGNKTSGMKLSSVIDLLRGPSGTEVEVVLGKKSEPSRKVIMKRGVIPMKHVTGFEVVGPGIAKVRIHSITASIVRDLRKLTPQLEENDIKGLVLQLDPQRVSYRPAMMFANALIDGGIIGAIDDAMDTRPVFADPGQLWPEVELAITTSGAPQDALAWAVKALEQHRNAYVHGSGTGHRLYAIQQAWKYEPVPLSNDLEGQSWVVVMPVARLLKTNPKSSGFVSLTEPGGMSAYARVNPQVFRRSHEAQELAAIEQQAAIQRSGKAVTPLSRSVMFLRMRLAQPNRQRELAPAELP